MKINLNKIDRALRMVLAILAIDLSVAGKIPVPVMLLFLFTAAYLFLTALIRYDPFYDFLGISTLKKENLLPGNKINTDNNHDLI